MDWNLERSGKYSRRLKVRDIECNWVRNTAGKDSDKTGQSFYLSGSGRELI